MARPSRCRRICAEPLYDSFMPDGFKSSENVVLTLDEYETIRLIDMEKHFSFPVGIIGYVIGILPFAATKNAKSSKQHQQTKYSFNQRRQIK